MSELKSRPTMGGRVRIRSLLQVLLTALLLYAAAPGILPGIFSVNAAEQKATEVNGMQRKRKRMACRPGSGRLCS